MIQSCDLKLHNSGHKDEGLFPIYNQRLLLLPHKQTFLYTAVTVSFFVHHCWLACLGSSKLYTSKPKDRVYSPYNINYSLR